MTGIKHLINCHCYLKIYQNKSKTIYHKFPVYSKLDKNGKIIPKYVKCNNCDAFHKVYEIQKSEIFAGKDQSESVKEIKDVSISLPDKLVKILSNYNKDIADYEHAIDIIKEKKWGTKIILKRDILNEMYQVKYILINGKNDYEIMSEIINDTIIVK